MARTFVIIFYHWVRVIKCRSRTPALLPKIVIVSLINQLSLNSVKASKNTLQCYEILLQTTTYKIRRLLIIFQQEQREAQAEHGCDRTFTSKCGATKLKSATKHERKNIILFEKKKRFTCVILTLPASYFLTTDTQKLSWQHNWRFLTNKRHQQ